LLNTRLPTATVPGEEMFVAEFTQVEAWNVNLTSGRYSQSAIVIY